MTSTTSPENRRASVRRPASARAPNALLGIFISMATMYLSINARRKAMIYLVWVMVLSIMGGLYEFPEFSLTQEAIIQRHVAPGGILLTDQWAGYANLGNLGYTHRTKSSFLNQWGVKIGWFWTLVTVTPFVWYVGKAHYRDRDNKLIDSMRLVVATGLWYFTVQIFHRVLAATAYCNNSPTLSRAMCSEGGGVWVPGIDISGHCFLMVFSILIIVEESSAFRVYLNTSRERPQTTKQFDLLVHVFFIAMFMLHVFWDFQLVISALYYHTVFDKVAGVGAAVGCWSLSYRILYRHGVLRSPLSATSGNSGRRQKAE